MFRIVWACPADLWPHAHREDAAIALAAMMLAMRLLTPSVVSNTPLAGHSSRGTPSATQWLCQSEFSTSRSAPCSAHFLNDLRAKRSCLFADPHPSANWQEQGGLRLVDVGISWGPIWHGCATGIAGQAPARLLGRRFRCWRVGAHLRGELFDEIALRDNAGDRRLLVLFDNVLVRPVDDLMNAVDPVLQVAQHIVL